MFILICDPLLWSYLTEFILYLNFSELNFPILFKTDLFSAGPRICMCKSFINREHLECKENWQKSQSEQNRGRILSLLSAERSLNLLRSLPSRLDRDARMPPGAAQKLYVRDPIIREEEQDSIRHQPNLCCGSPLVLLNMNRVTNIANHVQVPGGGKGGGAYG